MLFCSFVCSMSCLVLVLFRFSFVSLLFTFFSKRNTWRTIVLTTVPATGTRFSSSHSSPALRQPLSNILLSPVCIFRRANTKSSFLRFSTVSFFYFTLFFLFFFIFFIIFFFNIIISFFLPFFFIPSLSIYFYFHFIFIYLINRLINLLTYLFIHDCFDILLLSFPFLFFQFSFLLFFSSFYFIIIKRSVWHAHMATAVSFHFYQAKGFNVTLRQSPALHR